MKSLSFLASPQLFCHVESLDKRRIRSSFWNLKIEVAFQCLQHKEWNLMHIEINMFYCKPLIIHVNLIDELQ